MIKLTYTDEMKEQDLLWETEQENFETMKKLYIQIMNEGKAMGFTGVYSIYVIDEAVIEIYENEAEKEKCSEGKAEIESIFGYCKPLIHYLESVLNKSNDMNTRYCNKCRNKVSKSELKEYAYQCMECDEDLYSFETHAKNN